MYRVYSNMSSVIHGNVNSSSSIGTLKSCYLHVKCPHGYLVSFMLHLSTQFHRTGVRVYVYFLRACLGKERNLTNLHK
jgi:hypothetical protein